MDHRQRAQEKTTQLVALLQRQQASPAVETLVRECDALEAAISAFHMEAIRFRMFNVDRLLSRAGPEIVAGVAPLFVEIRHELEAAGFHTRSYQAPG
jgi:hypothetical protein